MERQVATINILPDEILLMIFSNISGHQLSLSVSKVCRRWKRLVSHIVLKIVNPGDDTVHRGVEALLVCYLPSLRRPNIYQIATLIPNLKELTISADYCLDEVDLTTVGTLRNLRHLDIFVNRHSMDQNIHMPKYVNSLVVNNNMAPGFLCEMATRRAVKAFHMYGRSKFYPPPELGKFIKSHSDYLTELTLRCSELTDRWYEVISQCKNLTSLQLYNCALLTSKGVLHIANLTNLRRLHLTGMSMVRTTSLLEFIVNMPQYIEELDLSYSWFGDGHYNALAARLPHLRCLELWRTKISVTCLITLVQLLTSLEDLDTDALFVNGQIRAMVGHPSLRNIRCRWLGPITPRFNIKSALEPVPVNLLRADEEGPRGGLFYYWLQDSTPPPRLGRGLVVRKTSEHEVYERPAAF